MDEAQLTRRIARLVGAFIEHVWPHMERPGGTPDEPMQQAKGSSNPPVGDYAHGMMDANRVAARYIGWALEFTLSENWRSSAGASYSQMLRDLRYDPGLVQTWRDRDPKMAEAYRELLRHVAKGVVFVHGQTRPEQEDLTRRLDLSPDDSEALVVRRAPNDEVEQRGRTRRGQKIDTMHTRRLMVDELEDFEERTGYKGREAMEILAERKQKQGRDWTVRKLREARTFVNKERRGERVELHSDRFHDFDGDAA